MDPVTPWRLIASRCCEVASSRPASRKEKFYSIKKDKQEAQY